MIEKMIETLAQAEAWTKGAFARTAKGRIIGPECKNAKCFCMEGAGLRVDRNGFFDAEHLIEAAVSELFQRRSPYGSIPYFNDHPDTTHDDVLVVLRRAREFELAAEE